MLNGRSSTSRVFLTSILVVLITGLGQKSFAQNIGVNGTGNNPDPSAMLHVEATDKGMIIPRVTLDDTANANPIAVAPAEGLMIYNETGTEPKGYYYWDAGKGQWIQVGTGAEDDDWDRDDGNGYMFPSNMGDQIGIGTNTPTTIPNTQVELNNSGFASMSFISSGVEGIFTSSSSNNRVSIGSYSNHDVYFFTGGSDEKMRMVDGGDLIINPAQNTTDLQVRGDTENYLIYADAADDRVGIGEDFPGHDLEVVDADGDGTAEIQIGTAELIQDRGANHLGTNSDWEVDQHLMVNDALEDNLGNTGNAGNILSSTGGAVEWKSLECLEGSGTVQDGFESGFGNWGNVGGDDDDWDRNSGSTGSTNTGPSGASEGSEYVYTETSGSSNGDQYFLQTSGDLCSGASITFDYHMYFDGSSSGTLELQVSTDGGATWTTEWSQTGDQGTNWNSATVNLGGYAGSSVSIRFSMTTGTDTDYQYDAALDDITITNITNVSSPGGSVRVDDDWIVDSTAQEIYPVPDSFTVGMGPEDNYKDLTVHIDNGNSTGTSIGIGSIEELIDQSSETTINNDFAPAMGDSGLHNLGASSRPWDEVFSEAYTTISDQRSKTGVKELSYGLDEVMKLNPVSYRYKKDNMFENSPHSPRDKSRRLGLIAQDVKPVIDEAVRTHHWDLKSEEDQRYVKKKNKVWGLTYNDFIPVLIKAIQEQQQQIQNEKDSKEALKQKVQELQKENRALEQRLERIEEKVGLDK